MPLFRTGNDQFNRATQALQQSASTMASQTKKTTKEVERERTLGGALKAGGTGLLAGGSLGYVAGPMVKDVYNWATTPSVSGAVQKGVDVVSSAAKGIGAQGAMPAATSMPQAITDATLSGQQIMGQIGGQAANAGISQAVSAGNALVGGQAASQVASQAGGQIAGQALGQAAGAGTGAAASAAGTGAATGAAAGPIGAIVGAGLGILGGLASYYL